MNVFSQLIGKKGKIAVIGLGYVGMPLAVAFAKHTNVIGFDTNVEKIGLYLSGKDPTSEVGDEAIKETTIEFTSDELKLKESIFFVIAVPTPINQDKTPDLDPVISATKIVGRNLTKNSVVVFESTVYPGVTEDVCVPILERESGLTCGKDFKLGYSPERINPGDKVNTLETIVKIVSGIDDESLDIIGSVYELIIKAGVHRAPSIKVAEAAKVVENSQRDINIAFMNELAMVFDLMNINTSEVIKAMNTKWNSLKFTPGLVGGHCIGVDPYYFIYEAEKLGYHSQIILSGRKINDGMGKFIAEAIIKELVLTNKVPRKTKIVILGITFKENTPDTRNTKVIDIIQALSGYGIESIVVDPVADYEEVRIEHGVELCSLESVNDADCVVLAVPHMEFLVGGLDLINGLFKDMPNNQKILIDIKSVFTTQEINKLGIRYWSL